MNKIVRRFFILIILAVSVACGSKVFRDSSGQSGVRAVIYPFAASDERQEVLPHLHYSLNASSINSKRGTVELSFYFMKEQGDSVLWVECVERVPIALIDTAGCRKWFGYKW